MNEIEWKGYSPQKGARPCFEEAPDRRKENCCGHKGGDAEHFSPSDPSPTMNEITNPKTRTKLHKKVAGG